MAIKPDPLSLAQLEDCRERSPILFPWTRIQPSTDSHRLHMEMLCLLLLVLALGLTGYLVARSSTCWNCTASDPALDVLRDTYATLKSSGGNHVAWPRRIGDLRPLNSHLIGSRRRALLGTRYYRVTYRMPMSYDRAYPDYEIPLLLEMVNTDGTLPKMWRETYGLRRDGRVVMGCGWRGPSVPKVFEIIVLIIAASWPLFIYRKDLFRWCNRM